MCIPVALSILKILTITSGSSILFLQWRVDANSLSTWAAARGASGGDWPVRSSAGNTSDRLFPRSARVLNVPDMNSDSLVRMFTVNSEPMTKLKASTSWLRRQLFCQAHELSWDIWSAGWRGFAFFFFNYPKLLFPLHFTVLLSCS